jgi:flagellar hook protein FlgE
MGYATGLSGIATASKKIDITSNNIANAQTVGYKAGQLYFAQVLASSQSAAGSSTTSFGAGSPRVLPQFSQGTITSTGNPLDIAINGDGFFRLKEGESTTYTRDGQFVLDKEGYVTSVSGARLQGFAVDANGTVSTALPVDLQVSNASIAAKPTTLSKLNVNLDARSALGIPANFDATDSSTYQSATSIPVHDILGGEHVVSLYFVKSSATQWDVFAGADGVMVGTTPVTSLAFNPDGTLDETTTPQPSSLTLPFATPLTFDLDMSSTTALSKTFGIINATDDGRGSGNLTGYSVDTDGYVIGSFSNGMSSKLAQVALATFNNMQGLRPLGSNAFAETSDSGVAKVGQPNTGSAGALQSGSLENSNIDLTNELVRMIEAQRIFQANAQSIKAQDEMLQTITNL